MTQPLPTALRNAIKYTGKLACHHFLNLNLRWLEHCGPNNDDELNYRPLDEMVWEVKIRSIG